MTKRVCECCGQPMPETRLGVRLPPLKARIFDAVKRAGRAGIDGDDLFRLVFGDRDVKRTCLKAHVWQINDAIEDTGYRIEGRQSFKLVRCPAYDPKADAWGSVDVAYTAIRDRVAAGGPPWEPK